MEEGAQKRYDISKLTFDTKITTGNLGKKNLQETDSTPTPKSGGNTETAAISSTQGNNQNHNGLYWIFGIVIIVLIIFAIVKALKRKNNNLR